MSGTQDHPDAVAQPGGPERAAEQPGPAPIPAEGTAAPPDADRIFANRGPGARFPVPDGTGQVPGGLADAQAQIPRHIATSYGAAGPYGASEPQLGGSVAPQERRRIQSRGRVAMVLGVGGVVFSVLLFPLGLALGLAATVLGFVARRAGHRVHLRVPGATTGFALGVAATAFSGLILVVAAVFWSEISDYQDCVSGANTNSAQSRCMTDLQDDITRRVAG